MRTPVIVMLVLATAARVGGAAEPAFDAGAAQRFAALALACVHQEYPNKIAHVLASDADVKPPRELTPAFFGCFDWHSSVHGHWLLVRLARTFPTTPFAQPARAALARSFKPANLAAEAAYLGAPSRPEFERPYGLAWLLQLAAELREWDDPQAREWMASMAPLEQVAVARLKSWIPKLSYPIRAGEHSQSAFAFGLVTDWARQANDGEMLRLLESSSRALHLADRACPLGYEPSGQDFLSPCLAEADLMRRFLPPTTFAAWLGGFLPAIPLDGSAAWLPVAVVSDRADGKLAHLDGLNLSRAWMLEGVAAGLPEADPRRASLLAAAHTHRVAGLAAVTGEHYAGGHWLGSFAVYLASGRGLPGGMPSLGSPTS